MDKIERQKDKQTDRQVMYRQIKHVQIDWMIGQSKIDKLSQIDRAAVGTQSSSTEIEQLQKIGQLQIDRAVAERQIDRQTDRQMDGQIDRQIIYTSQIKHIHIYIATDNYLDRFLPKKIYLERRHNSTLRTQAYFQHSERKPTLRTFQVVVRRMCLNKKHMICISTYGHTLRTSNVFQMRRHTQGIAFQR